MEGKASTRAKNKYRAKAYDRFDVIVPKGHKATVEQAAVEAGESVNAYTNRALLDRMGLLEWPGRETSLDNSPSN